MANFADLSDTISIVCDYLSDKEKVGLVQGPLSRYVKPKSTRRLATTTHQ